MKKRICALVCAILLCCGPAAAGAEPVQSTLESGENIFVFSLIGDCCIGDNAWSPGTQGGYLNKIKKAGFDYPFSLVADMFAEDDLTVANCECTFTDRLKHRNGIYFPMLAPTSYAEVLRLGNVDVCNLANNHCLRDVGKKGGEETAAALTAQGIGYFYDDNTWSTEVKGVKVGFVGFTYPMNNGKLKRYVKAMEKLRAEGCTFVVASAHWGTEPTQSKSTGKEYLLDGNQKYGVKLIDAGFDMVYGHGSHTCQMIRWYKGKVIFYGLSNFTFGADATPRDDDTVVAQISFDIHEDGTMTAREMTAIPFKMHKDGDYRPYPVSDETVKQRIWEKMYYNGYPKHKASPASSLPESFLTTGYVDFRTLPATED
ncbi:MAG: CapA family protein [Clostridiales bacterium]|nr:CapA family protein [Clostridiales bacterium]